MELEVEPVFDDLLVHLISLAIVDKSQKENIGEKHLVLNTRLMSLFGVLLCCRSVQPILSSTRDENESSLK